MRCVAVGCKTGRKSGLRIHSFPRDPKRRLEWAVKVNIAENGKLWVPPRDCCYGICEAHFEEDQYEPRRTDRKLKPFATPTLFPHRKAPKRRRALVRVNQAQKNGGAVGEASVASSSAAATGAVTVTTATSGVVTPTGSSAVVTGQQAGLGSAVTNSLDAASSRGHRPRVGQLATTTRSVAEPAFTVATSGGNIILVPATTVNSQAVIIGQPPVVMQARATAGATAMGVATASGSRAVNPNAFTSVAAARAVTPVQSQNLVLPPLGCLPNAGPIILVPMSQPSMVTTVSRARSAATVVQSAYQSSPMPVILSVESLSGRVASAATSVVSAPPPPLVARPPTYDELRRDVEVLKQDVANTRRELCETARQMARVKTALSRQTERLARFLRTDQVDSLVKGLGDTPVAWTEPTQRFALDIYRFSPKAYRALLAGNYPLPSESALRKFCVEHGVRDGVPPELMEVELPDDELVGANIVWL